MNEHTRVANPLPRTVAELRKDRPQRPPSIIAAARVHYDALFDDTSERGAQFRLLLEGFINPDTVEGTTRLDDAEAARMMREHAREVGDDYFGRKNLATTIYALRIIMDKDGINRSKLREQWKISGGAVSADEPAENSVD
jgi:hypothetical protein